MRDSNPRYVAVQQFSRLPPSTTRPILHGAECPVWDCKGSKNFLLKPLYNVVLCVQVVNCQANPAGSEDKDCADDFSNDADGLLEDVDDCQDGQYKTYEVNN